MKMTCKEFSEQFFAFAKTSLFSDIATKDVIILMPTSMDDFDMHSNSLSRFVFVFCAGLGKGLLISTEHVPVIPEWVQEIVPAYAEFSSPEELPEAMQKVMNMLAEPKESSARVEFSLSSGNLK